LEITEVSKGLSFFYDLLEISDLVSNGFMISLFFLGMGGLEFIELFY
jgi:hypothetical protein